MRRRERALIGRYVEEAVAPAPPLPAVTGTDAVDAFGAQLAAAPRANRLAIRALLLAQAVGLPLGPAREPLRADRKSTRLNSSHIEPSRMPSSA